MQVLRQSYRVLIFLNLIFNLIRHVYFCFRWLSTMIEQAVLLACLMTSSLALHQSSASLQQHSNRVVDVKTSCDKETFHVELTMEKPFKGLVFSKDFSRECRNQGLSNSKQ